MISDREYISRKPVEDVAGLALVGAAMALKSTVTARRPVRSRCFSVSSK